MSSLSQKSDGAALLQQHVADIAREVHARVAHLKRVQDFVDSKVKPLLAAQATFIRLVEQKASAVQLTDALAEYRTRRFAYMNDHKVRDSLRYFKLATPYLVNRDRSYEFNAIIARRTAEERDAADPTGEERLGATVAAFKRNMPENDASAADSTLGERLAPFGVSALPELYHRAKAIYATLAGESTMIYAQQVKLLLQTSRRRKTQGYYGFRTPATVNPLNSRGDDKITVVAEDAALVLLLICGRLLLPSSA